MLRCCVVFILIEKRLLLRRGVIRCDRLREPTLHLDEAYRAQIEELRETANYLVNGLSGMARVNTDGQAAAH